MSASMRTDKRSAALDTKTEAELAETRIRIAVEGMSAAELESALTIFNSGGYWVWSSGAWWVMPGS